MHSRWTISLLAAALVGMPTLAKAEKANQFEYFLAQQPKIERTVVDGLEITNIVIDQSKSNSTSSAPNKKNAVVKSAPKDGNEGTYPLAGSSKAKKHQVKTIAAPKDGTEGTYPTAKTKSSSNVSSDNQFTVKIRPAQGNKNEQTTGVLMPAPAIPALTVGESGFQYDNGVLDTTAPNEAQTPVSNENFNHPTATKALDNSELSEGNSSKESSTSEVTSAKDKALSVPYVPKNVQTVTENAGYPTTERELKALLEDPKLTRTTPRYFVDNCMRNAEINKFAKAKVRYDIASVRGANLLLLAFHMPPLPKEGGQAAKAWILDGNKGIRTIDMRDLPVGVYQFCALALDQNNQPTAKPNTDRFMVRYGGLEALVDYNDRRYIMLGAKNDKPSGFADVELADAVAETPLFKIVPATCVLRPGEHIVLTAEALPTKHEQRIQRIHEHYGLKVKNTTDTEENGAEPTQAKKKRYLWAISGRGRLEVINDNSAIYYAPKDDTTGAQISCREEGSDNVATASMYVTTMPLGEMPRLEEFTP